LLGGMPSETGSSGPTHVMPGGVFSRFEKVRSLIQKGFALVWFSSRDIQSIYEQEFKEPVSLSTISTYLARMTNKGWLTRAGESNSLKYKVAPNVPPETVRQRMK